MWLKKTKLRCTRPVRNKPFTGLPPHPNPVGIAPGFHAFRETGRRFFFLLALVLLAGTSRLHAGNDPLINESFTNVSLKQALEVLSENYNLKLAYADKLVEPVGITLELKNVAPYPAFQRLLNGTAITFEFIEPNIFILKKQKGKRPDLTGQLTDATSREPIPFAFIRYNDKGATTNEEGYFTLSRPFTFPLNIQVNSLGYQDSLFAIRENRANQRLQLQLQPRPTTLQEVVVEELALKQFKAAPQLTTVDVDPDFTADFPSAAEKDVFRMIQLLPGVNATDELSSGLAVNGGTNTQNLLRLDGFTLYHVDHFFGYFSALNPLAIQSLRLFKGGFAPKYGDRASSILEVQSKDGNNDRVSGAIDLNLLSVNTALELPLSSNTTLFFSGRRSYTDVVSTGLFENLFSLYAEDFSTTNRFQQEYSFTPDFYYNDLNAKLTSRLAGRHKVSLAFYDSNDMLTFSESFAYRDTLTLENSSRGSINWGNTGASARWSAQWNSTVYTDLLVSYSRYNSHFDEQSAYTVTNRLFREFTSSTTGVQNNFIEDTGINFTNTLSLGPHTVEQGIGVNYFNVGISNIRNDEVLTQKEQTGVGLISGFIQDDYSWQPGGHIVFGLRYNYLSTTNRWYAQPRLSVAVPLNAAWQLSGATGIYRQFVNQVFTENELEGSRDIWVLADHRVPEQQAVHNMLGLAYTDDGLTVTLNYYNKQFEGLIDYAFSRGGNVTEYPVTGQRQFFRGSGNASGAELLIKKTTPVFTSWLSYTLGEVKYTFPGLNRGEPFYASHDQRHEITAYGLVNLGRWNLFATWYYGSGKPYSDFTINELPPNRREDLVLITALEKNGRRLPAYHRLDAGINYNQPLEQANLEVGLNLFNLYNRMNVYDRNVQLLRRPDAGSSRLPAGVLARTVDTNLLGFTASFSVKVIF